ncbi:response regulator [Salsuginibacillus kocurii]|uniref:response regulator n=1 Tax=Salsuginibacillus kocurii TaxID=427078 RepID=UPI00035FDFEA|nr:response regulator [Salsuginibacillus kocurii]
MRYIANTYSVLIVEDDFRVAEINKAFVEELPSFKVVHSTKTGAETKSFLESDLSLPDLILLDIYIPDVTGLELLWHIRSTYPGIDIIMMTAANETSTIQEALQAGIFDYIMKPVQKERTAETLQRYKKEKQALSERSEISQEELDQLRYGGTQLQTKASEQTEELPKGIDHVTLENIRACLQENGKQGTTAVMVSKAIGASRSTARRYLEYLISIEEVRAEVSYGEVGRPERRYLFI